MAKKVRGNVVNGIRCLDANVLGNLDSTFDSYLCRIADAKEDGRTIKALNTEIGNLLDSLEHKSNKIPSEFDKIVPPNWRSRYVHGGQYGIAPWMLTEFLVSPLMPVVVYRRFCTLLNQLAEFAMAGDDVTVLGGLLTPLEIALNDYRRLRSPSEPVRRVLSAVQRNVLDALDGSAMTGDQLQAELGVGRNTLYGRKNSEGRTVDGLMELQELGMVRNDRRIGGYYRPDHPPAPKN